MENEKQMMSMSWAKFAAMIATSTLVMFFLMYQLVYNLDHATFSVNRLVSALVMGCIMASVMLAFMWSMYHGKTTKWVVLIGGLVLAVALILVNRSQALIGDVAFMQSMIPHHSIAINNARAAQISGVTASSRGNPAATTAGATAGRGDGAGGASSTSGSTAGAKRSTGATCGNGADCIGGSRRTGSPASLRSRPISEVSRSRRPRRGASSSLSSSPSLLSATSISSSPASSS